MFPPTITSFHSQKKGHERLGIMTYILHSEFLDGNCLLSVFFLLAFSPFLIYVFNFLFGWWIPFWYVGMVDSHVSSKNTHNPHKFSGKSLIFFIVFVPNFFCRHVRGLKKSQHIQFDIFRPKMFKHALWCHIKTSKWII